MITIFENADGTYTIDGYLYGRVTMEAFFSKFIKDLKQVEDQKEYPDRIFWLNKNGKYLFEHDKKHNIFWCSSRYVWSIFEKTFKVNHSEVQSFMIVMAETIFKCEGVTESQQTAEQPEPIEEHFKSIEAI